MIKINYKYVHLNARHLLLLIVLSVGSRGHITHVIQIHLYKVRLLVSQYFDTASTLTVLQRMFIVISH